MDCRKCTLFDEEPSLSMAPSNISNKVHAKAQFDELAIAADHAVADVNIDLREVYFLIMHFLSAGPCKKTFGQIWNELLEHQLLPRRYHAWYSRSGVLSGDANDDGVSFPLDHADLVERYPQVDKDHLVKLLKELILSASSPLQGMVSRSAPSAADVTTLLGTGPFSLLGCDRSKVKKEVKLMPAYLRWPHIQADQVHGLSLREIGGGFSKHHRAPSIRFACYAIAKPSTMVQKMQNLKKLRGHRDAVYCAIFDRSGRYVITGSDDRLVKIWSMETAFCLTSCRGHEGDITDLAVSSNNAVVASASNDYNIRVWRLPDGYPMSVLRGHTGAVTAIAFSPRPGSIYQLLSSSDDGTCRIWDARSSQGSPRIYIPKSTDATAGNSNAPSTSNGPSSSNGSHSILCCAYNAIGTLFVTGSSDTSARVWSVSKSNSDKLEQPNHEIDLLAGHEMDVNYVQFSGCAVASRSSTPDTFTEENIPKFKNSWFSHDNIVTCSRDGSAIIWVPRSRRSHGKVGRWTRAYHLKVPPPPVPPKPPRGGPRQRLLPTPRGVNMIMWSLDNRFVLAAIMDCRICVWNASDGSLVHSLTGHSASTFVLDVHPFNPRIAMSAGYDGKTIVWDIWEGTPIRIYEIGRFKLVDGKFSPDGTSIVLSDEVGQLYFLNTGQGESQKDAKYDQFFLGDYRLLVQDTQGSTLDQETQLAPHKRNIQDPLCDSTMVPYPEPYQSMYQKLRLGALGIEWRPSSIKFATGNDAGLGQYYQMLPLEDLDGLIEPLPEFIDAMYWEPENEVINDDTDSEYNVPEEYFSEGEHESLSAGTSSEPECSSEDNKDERSHKNVLRRSKRKRKRIKAEVKLMTSSGRHVRKRNSDEHDGTSSGNKRTKKSNKGRKTLKGNSSKAKSLRSQRLAARNALNVVSHITEASTEEEDEGVLENDSSESELMLEDSDIQSHEHDINLQNVQEIYSKAEQTSLDPEHVASAPKVEASQTNVESRKRLVIKFSLRNSKTPVPSAENSATHCHNQGDLALSSQPTLETPKENWIKLSSEDSESSSPNVIGGELSANQNITNCCDREHEKVEDHLETAVDYRHAKIKWGEVKLRTSKMKPEDLITTDTAGFSGSFDVRDGNTNDVNDYGKPGMGYGDPFSRSEIQDHGGTVLTEACKNKEQSQTGASGDMDIARSEEFTRECSFQSPQWKFPPLDDLQQTGSASAAFHHDNFNKEYKESSGSDICQNYDSAVSMIRSHELKENPPSKPTKLKITSKNSLRDPRGPLKLKCKVQTGAGDDSASESHSCMKQNLVFGLPKEDEIADRPWSKQKLDSHSDTKIDVAVYKENNLDRARTNPKDFHGVSKPTSHNQDSGFDIQEAVTDEMRRTRSVRLKATSTSRETRDMNNVDKVRDGHKSVKTSRSAENPSKKAFDQLPSDEILHPKMTLRSKSTRSKEGGNYDDPSCSAGKKTPTKSNWLMLSEQEEGFRYIPQLGDEVIYLRQGHQEYLEWTNSLKLGPWMSNKGNIRAVETCSVEGLDYAAAPGSGESCCKLDLKFIDTSSSAFGRTFKLTLPELIDCPDFFVERTWYDAAIRRNWSSRDKCLVWWRDESGEGGKWWKCRIQSSKDKSHEFPGSPWERYVIQYKNEPEPRLHSPWELYDPASPWEHPHIDFEIKNKLLSLFNKLEHSASRNQDKYGILKLEQVVKKSDFVNRYPVPLSFKLIKRRLEKDYYRSLKAMEHDFMVMLSNVQDHVGKNVEFATKMKRLSDCFHRTMSKL